MKDNNYYSIISKIELIEKTDKLLRDLKGVKETPLKTVGWQFERKKQKLIKELLIEMVNAGIGFNQFETIYLQIFTYLKAKENGDPFPKELQNNMNQLKELLVV